MHELHTHTNGTPRKKKKQNTKTDSEETWQHSLHSGTDNTKENVL